MNDRNRLSDLLEESEGAVRFRKFFPHVLDLIPSIVMVFDLQRERNVWANDRAREFFHSNVAEAGESDDGGLPNFADVVYSAHQAAFRSHRAKLERISDDEACQIELQARDGNGDWHWFLMEERVCTRDAQGKPHLIVSSALDITERREQEIQRHYMIMELDHRVKNTLSIIQSIANQTAKTESAQIFARHLMSRVRGLIASQDAFQNDNLPSAGLHDLVQAQCAILPAYMINRIKCAGPVVRLNAKVYQTIGMAFHELIVNAVSHGALSNDHGHIQVSWSLDRDADGEQVFRLQWKEAGGPKFDGFPVRGFGHNLLTRVVSDMTGGRTKFAPESDGVCWEIEAPASSLLFSSNDRTVHPLPAGVPRVQP